MTIATKCPHCGNPCSFPDGSYGRKARCLGCQQIFVVEKEAPVIELELEPSAPPADEETQRITAAPPRKPARGVPPEPDSDEDIPVLSPARDSSRRGDDDRPF